MPTNVDAGTLAEYRLLKSMAHLAPMAKGSRRGIYTGLALRLEELHYYLTSTAVKPCPGPPEDVIWSFIFVATVVYLTATFRW